MVRAVPQFAASTRAMFSGRSAERPFAGRPDGTNSVCRARSNSPFRHTASLRALARHINLIPSASSFSCHATCNANAGHAARAQAVVTKAIHQHLHAPLSSSPPRSSKSGQQHLSRVFFGIRDLTANVRASALEPNEHARDRLPIDTRKRSPTRDACASDGASARSALACSMA